LRIALVDHQPLFRAGLRLTLSGAPDLSVVAEADSAHQAYEVARTHTPDVMVIDFSLPGVDGVTVTQTLCGRSSRMRVLILGIYTDEVHAARALAAGATGYAAKNQSADELLEAVRRVGRGERTIPPCLSPSLLEAHQRNRDASPLALLSPREREVFALLIRGFANRQAARELSLSVKTIETHRSHIHTKLGVHSIAQLIRFAAIHGVIEPQP
jgi:DNA-binding NarL/FixJ family response regulator